MRGRRGFTLIELLTVVVILGLLTALLLPAIQNAREAGRAVACKSNLRGLAQAASNYYETHNSFPGWLQIAYGQRGETAGQSVPSIHLQLLPYLEAAHVYDLVNWSVEVAPDHSPAEAWKRSIQETAANVRIASFLCPSDPNVRVARAPNNYRACWGQGPMWRQTHLFPDSQNGSFASAGPGQVYRIGAEFIFDGLSHTAFFSERVIGDGNLDRPNRFSAMVDQYGFEDLGAFTADDEVRVCSALNRVADIGFYASAGHRWFYSGAHHTLYTHVFPPNAAPSDCVSFGFSVPVGAASARSFHPGCVHLVTVDGAVRAVSSNVSLAAWRALASRNGGEVHGSE